MFFLLQGKCYSTQCGRKIHEMALAVQEAESKTLTGQICVQS